jgi:hypothetical protein
MDPMQMVIQNINGDNTDPELLIEVDENVAFHVKGIINNANPWHVVLGAYIEEPLNGTRYEGHQIHATAPFDWAFEFKLLPAGTWTKKYLIIWIEGIVYDKPDEKKISRAIVKCR